MRCFAIGDCDPRWPEVLEKACGSVDAVAAAVKPGEPMEKVVDTAKAYLDDQGIGQHAWFIGGYVQGIAIPPDWVGHVYLGGEGFERSDFMPGMMTNYENVFRYQGLARRLVHFLYRHAGNDRHRHPRALPAAAHPDGGLGGMKRSGPRTRTDFPHEVAVDETVWIPLADGTRLAARIWKPVDADDHPVPVILEYIPYRRRDGTRFRDEPMHGYFAGHGYASVRVDLRGAATATDCSTMST